VASFNGLIGSENSFINSVALDPGNLVDSVSSLGGFPKFWDGAGVSYFSVGSGDGTNVTKTLERNGYWTLDGNNILVFPVYISDRLSARPQKIWRALTLTGSVAAYTNNGAWAPLAAPTVSPATLNIAVNQTGTIDILDLASGSGTLTLSDSYYQPDHGRMSVNDPTPGIVTYKPDRGYRGQDLAWLWVENGRGGSTRVDLIINIGVTAAQPFGTGEWSVVDSATANAVNLRIISPPDTGGRQIEKIEYTTDGGATWKRYCWGQRIGTLTITTESDGTALAAGSYDFQLRYVCKIDGTTVAASAVKSVTVA
jgi:hypothetical protein